MNLVIDIGGTKTRIGIYTNGDSFFKEVLTIPTPKSTNELIVALKNYIGFIEIKRVVIGIAGVVNLNNELIFSPHLSQFNNINLRDLLLKDVLGYNIEFNIFNDVSLASFGEATNGKSNIYSRVLYLSIGTGLGGGFIINKQLNSHLHFEPGHMLINTSNDTDSFLEDIIAGSGITKRYSELPDKENREFWSNIEVILSKSIVNMILLLNPDCIVFGGGLILGDKLDINNLRDSTFNNLRIKYLMPEIFKTDLGDLITLKGAISYIKRSSY